MHDPEKSSRKYEVMTPEMYEIFPMLVAGILVCSFLEQDTPDPRMSDHVNHHGSRHDGHLDLAIELSTIAKHLNQASLLLHMRRLFLPATLLMKLSSSYGRLQDH